jgi:hypothetical protein
LRAILDKMLRINPEDEAIILVAARYSAWEKDSHLQADNKMSLRQEKAEIRSAVNYLIKNFDESKSTSYFLTRLRDMLQTAYFAIFTFMNH